MKLEPFSFCAKARMRYRKVWAGALELTDLEMQFRGDEDAIMDFLALFRAKAKKSASEYPYRISQSTRLTSTKCCGRQYGKRRKVILFMIANVLTRRSKFSP